MSDENNKEIPTAVPLAGIGSSIPVTVISAVPAEEYMQPSAPNAPTSVPTSITVPTPALQQATIFEQYCVKTEMRQEIKADLLDVVQSSTVVMLLDDSGSMGTTVRTPGASFFAPTTTTRWSELMGDTLQILELVLAASGKGVDVHFMNREGVQGVRDPSQLQRCFEAPPRGGTPMIGSLQCMFQMYSSHPKVLLILVTDGEPSDGDYNQLFYCINQMPRNIYLSMVECNDNEEEMDYLTGWDTKLPRFHNQEDYGEELNLIRRVNGPNAKFTRANYVQMICLSPMYPKYAIDIRAQGGKRNPFSGGSIGGGWGWDTGRDGGGYGGGGYNYQTGYNEVYRGSYNRGYNGFFDETTLCSGCTIC